MQGLFARIGVDYVQWKAVSRTLLRSDFRPPVQQTTETYSLRTAGGLLMMMLIYGMFGLSAALIALLNRDVLLTGSVTLTYVAMLVTTALLTQHSATIVSTADYAVLGPLPVSSKTFFAIRLTNILFHTTLLTTVMGYPPILVHTFAHGVSVSRGLAMTVALYAFSSAVTFAVVAAYGTLLRFFGPSRLERVLSYAQLIIGLLSYLGIIIVLRIIGRSLMTTATLPRGLWLLFFPPAWYASYLEIATGVADGGAWLRALLSIVFLGGMFMLLRGPLAADYADSIAQLASRSTPDRPQRAARRAWLFTRGEARAVALLVRAQFRHDIKVRLGILSIVPMTLLYMYMGASQGSPGDPFVAGSSDQGFDMMAFVVLFFPSILVQQLATSDAFRAAWIYFATPADRGNLIVAMKNVIIVFFMLPFTVFLFAVFAWRFSDPGHAFVHAVFLGLIGHLVVQVTILVAPRLPFASSPQKSSGNTGLLAAMMLVIVAGNLFLMFLRYWAYAEWTRTAVIAAVLVAVTYLMNGPIRARAEAADELPAWI